MTAPQPGPPTPWVQPPRRGRHSSLSMTDRARWAIFRAYSFLSRAARVWHSGLAAVVVGACVAAFLAAAASGVAKVAKPVDEVSVPAAGDIPPIGTFSRHPVHVTLPTRPESYLGAFAKGVPESYAPMDALAKATGAPLNVALYYSGWPERFQDSFAIRAQGKGAVPFIQIDPEGINLAAIIAGAYDTYLQTFATSVAYYGARTGKAVIIGFGHEMNGHWYSWGYRHTPPAVFVGAWRHIVTIFRNQGADNVAWLWTINIIDNRFGIPSPGPWWPGDSYVTWVGIDGYYLKPKWTFASLFGPTIKAIRALTLDPILIAETGATPAVGQPAKIADLFAGVRAYGLLGFVWFDAKGTRDWRLISPAALAAFRRGAQAYPRPG
jgi:mannan endo-1,4-beta-mannosidase